MTLSDLSVSQLKRAVSIKEAIEKLNKDLRAILGESGNSTRSSTRTMTLTQRRKIAAAQKARWAELKRGKSERRSAKPAAKKSMSPATRKKLSAKLKAYWATKRREK
jgi:hypothetical protein